MNIGARDMANQMLWMLLLLCMTACSDQTERFRSVTGEGRLSLSEVKIEVGILNTPLTKGTPSHFIAPAPDALTYTLTHAESSTSQRFSYNELIASPVLSVGHYTLTATYGSNQMSTAPYLYYSTTFTIQALQTTTLPRISVPLACAIIRPSVDDLLPHFKSDVQFTLSDETGNSLNVTNLTDYYVPAGKSYTLRISGTNQLGETKTIQGSISEAASRTRYILNCTADLPIFTLPEQPDYNAWSYHIDFIPLTESNISYTGGMERSKILNNLTYEYTTDGGATWHAFTGTKLTGLTPSTTYTFRARLGAVQSSNQVSLTTEGAEPVPNGDFEDLVQTISVTEMDQGGQFRAGLIDYQNWATYTVYEPKGWSSINAKTCYEHAACRNTWFTNPSTYATNIKWTSKWGIVNNQGTPDIYNNLSAQNGQTAMILRNVAWDTNGTKPSKTGGFTNTTYYCKTIPTISNRSAGRLFIGSYMYDGNDHFSEGTSFSSRPIKISGYYKYQDYVGNEKPNITLRLLHGSTLVSSASMDLPNSASSYTYFEIPISYSSLSKVNQLQIMISSSNQSTITTNNVIYEKEAISRGAQLTIDNLTFTYD